MRHFLLVIFASLITLVPARAQSSTCHAFVEGIPGVRYATLGPVASISPPVKITYVGHSTFRIETAEGVMIATDFFGAHGGDRAPDVVTMNHAHETHYTDFPDPAIPHVLRGWNPLRDGPAEHRLTVRDVTIRNVTTDIRGWGSPEKDGNSIFVFEVADLCIAHLGHLHHTLDEPRLAMLGRMDIVMAPVDGTYTLALPDMIALLKRVKARIVLPMHAFGAYSMNEFLTGMSDEFRVRREPLNSITVSLDTLPSEPEVILLSNRVRELWED